MAHQIPNTDAWSADPTLQYAQLRHDLIADPQIRKRLDRINDGNTSLVLSGGGGKGAYEAGVILALFDCGVRRFKSIAGTSVGALNAALCHELIRAGDRNLVLRMWLGISRGKVWRLSRGLPLKVALFLAAALSMLTVDRVGRAVGRLRIPRGWRGGEVPEAAIFAAGILILVPLVACVGFGYLFVVSVFLSSLGVSGAVGQVPLALLAAVAILYWLGPAINDWIGVRLSFLSNAPLRETIEAIDVARVRESPPPVVCTVAEPVQTLVENGVTRDRGPPVPSYFVLGRTDTVDEAKDILLQSAALPEVFPVRAIGDRLYVDGGIADNTPILGVAPETPALIIVVYLTDRYRNAPEDELRMEERRRVEQISYRRGFDWDNHYGPWYDRVEFVPIVPSIKLGRFFNGTLNFSAPYARCLLACGYRDTLKRLRNPP